MGSRRNTNRNSLRSAVLVDGNLEYDILSGERYDFTDAEAKEVSIRLTERYVGRLDLLSYNVYGTVDMWWLIAERNDIEFPIDEMYVGQILIVPSVGDYYQFFNRISTLPAELDIVFDKKGLILD